MSQRTEWKALKPLSNDTLAFEANVKVDLRRLYGPSLERVIVKCHGYGTLPIPSRVAKRLMA